MTTQREIVYMISPLVYTPDTKSQQICITNISKFRTTNPQGKLEKFGIPYSQ